MRMFSSRASAKLGGRFRLETEAVFPYGNALRGLPLHHLVAGFHVGQVEVGERIGERGEEEVPHAVPVVKHPVTLPAYGARPLKRVIQRELETPFSRMIIAGEVMKGKEVHVSAKGDELAFAVR